MSGPERTEELFSEWQRTQASPTELCREFPELLEELETRIRTWENSARCQVEGQQLPMSIQLSSDSSPTQLNVPVARNAGNDQIVDASAVNSLSNSLQFNSPSTQPYPLAGDAAPAPWVDQRYRLTRLLGKGGFGEVWQAFDTTLRRVVALKMPRHDRATSEEQRRLFLAEARKIAALKHPHIVPIFDAVAETDRWFLVCEYIDGTSLAQKIDKERLSFADSARLVATIAEALHFAHRHDMVHRDVKPGNILLDKAGKPYLTDFGLAVSENDLLREHPLILGTFAYMSPEQARGESHLVDARSDIYSLGVVLYRLLTGRLPFKASNTAEYREQILQRPIRPPRTIDDQIPPELEDICLKCLGKTPQDRFKTAKDLADALNDWSKPKPTRLKRWRVALAVGLIAAVTVAVALWRNTGSPDAKIKPDIAGHFDEEQAGIKPNVWYSMLRWKPNRLSFPGPPSKLDWEPGGPLLVHCTDAGLISLGKAKRPGYEISVKLRQETWHGNFGIFVGYHHGVFDALPYCGYQLFKFEKSGTLDVFRSMAKETEFGRLGRPIEDVFKAARLPFPPAKYCEFSLVVDNDGIHSVKWEGNLLEPLGAEEVNVRLRKDHPLSFQGDYGIQTRTGTTSVLDFEIRFLDSYFLLDKNR